MKIGFVVSLVSGVVLCTVTIPILHRVAILDVPNERSSHSSPVVRGGGIAVVLATLFGVTASGEGSTEIVLSLVVATGAGLVGLLDDLLGLGAASRLLTLLLLGASWGVFSDVAGHHLHGFAGPLLCSVWIAAMVNAFNFMDGINGISSLTGALAGGAYSAIALIVCGSLPIAAFGIALAGASLAFLPFNFPRARAFMGDVGSYFLGCSIALLALLVWMGGAALPLAMAPTLLYLADTGTALLRRARRGDSLTTAHREHAYQRLVDSGCAQWVVALLVFTLELAVIALGWAGTSGLFPMPFSAVLILFVVAWYLGLPALLNRRGTPRILDGR